MFGPCWGRFGTKSDAGSGTTYAAVEPNLFGSFGGLFGTKVGCRVWDHVRGGGSEHDLIHLGAVLEHKSDSAPEVP